MIYFQDMNQQQLFCPLCGSNSFDNPCKHVVAIFLEEASVGEGCVYLSPDVREKFFPDLQEGFPVKFDSSEKLKRTSKLFRKFSKENKTFMLSYREYEPRTYEWPIVRVVYRADLED